ncbi:OmpA family protein [Geomonas sp. Red32]|uniref:OmpA family protein n=1 Tax=Geomonas sp. Red32 TaxID=2912856 RepID=UPI00202CC26B|nr:OmpA family protein [Geomonas sp. Red32]MCM0083534.1 OmpA family protein [Geomonas sp. Red32]
MEQRTFVTRVVLSALLVSSGMIAGCANYEVNTHRGSIPGHYIRYEMQEADRAVESARAAGKDKQCPNEFKSAEDAKNHAYDVYRACFTEEGAQLAKEATAKANALCPAVPKAVYPVPSDTLTLTPATVTKGDSATLSWTSKDATNCDIQPGIGAVPASGSMQVTPDDTMVYTLTCTGEGGTAKDTARATVQLPPPAPVPAPAPKPLLPSNNLAVQPQTVMKGQSATLMWSSRNASDCAIDQGVGAVNLQGSMPVTPAEDTSYTLTCNGAGGSVTSSARVAVTTPPPVEPPPQAAPVVDLCKPTVLDIHFDTNKWDIKPQYSTALLSVADFLKRYPAATGTIEGYTDSVGNRAANMSLSQKRADSIRKYLIDKFGVAPDRIKAAGYGPKKPIADNKTAAGRAKNRRIEANFSCN